MDTNELLRTHMQEIRRGSVVIAVLSILEKSHYGYALIDILAQSGIDAEANTLYPLLRRLEKLGLLESEWNTDESRPRKYYRTTTAGSVLGSDLLQEWNRIAASLNSLEGTTK